MSSTLTPNSQLFYSGSTSAGVSSAQLPPISQPLSQTNQQNQHSGNSAANQFRPPVSAVLAPPVTAASPQLPLLPPTSHRPDTEIPTSDSQSEEGLKPSVPYHDLPAGLMVPLVGLAEREYKPLNPDDLRLPPPKVPSEKLLKAVDEFYSAPLGSKPRDNDGWNRKFIDDYTKKKGQAMVQAMIAK